MQDFSKKTVTQKDVAREARVNQTVVSAVMRGANGTVKVSEVTRQRVLEVAAALDYRPNASARSMRSGSFGSLGYFLTSHHKADFDYPEYRAGLLDGATAANQRVMLVRLAVDRDGWQQDLERQFREASLDAMIVHHSVVATPELDRQLAASGMPIVFLNEPRPKNSIAVDDRGAMRKLLSHLTQDAGYRRPRYVRYLHQPSALGMHAGMAARLAEFRRFGGAAGWNVTPHVFGPGSRPKELVALVGRRGADVIVCENDACALQVQSLAAMVGLLAGRDFGISGYNDEDLCRFMPVPLTTVRVPRYEMANRAVTMVLGLAAQKTSAPCKSEVFEPELVVRESTPGTKRRRSRKCGFTVVETIVVMATIAILAALLVPALNRVSAGGREASGLSNLRQVGLAAISYATDHDGALPYGQLGGNQGDFRSMLSSYVAGQGGSGVSTLSIDAVASPESDRLVGLLARAPGKAPGVGMHVNLHQWTIPVFRTDTSTPRVEIHPKILDCRLSQGHVKASERWLHTTDPMGIHASVRARGGVPIPLYLTAIHD